MLEGLLPLQSDHLSWVSRTWAVVAGDKASLSGQSLGGFGQSSPPLFHPAQLEAQLLHLSSTQQEASLENLQLREVERDLTGQLEEVRGQLQVTRGHLDTARTRGRVSWQVEEEPRQVTILSR